MEGDSVWYKEGGGSTIIIGLVMAKVKVTMVVAVPKDLESYHIVQEAV